jgi:hypothetical protein
LLRREWREDYARYMLKLDFEPLPGAPLQVSTNLSTTPYASRKALDAPLRCHKSH